MPYIRIQFKPVKDYQINIRTKIKFKNELRSKIVNFQRFNYLFNSIITKRFLLKKIIKQTTGMTPSVLLLWQAHYLIAQPRKLKKKFRIGFTY